MPYEPLHHKYRPQKFRDLIGQEAIATTLINALKLEKIAPAYLFTGPRGTGKTSSARILAKSLNCLAVDRPTPEPCGQCAVCQAIASGNALDVMEIDAASNTGVDNIREVIERSHFAPVQSRYKVYAIDECHMLSTPAFNALLKTLEEPPPRVVFVLATTDPQRVIPTIISRCQRFDYRRIPQEAMVDHLSYICEEEEIRITPEALTLIAQIANGGLRDAESLLDQLSLFPQQITVEQIWDLVGAVPERELLALLVAIRTGNIESILAQCRSLLDRGREPLVLLQNLASFYLHLLVAQTAPSRQDLAPVTETCWQKLVTEAQQWSTDQILQSQQQLKAGAKQLKSTTQPRLWLEILLLGLLPQATSLTDSTSNIPDISVTPTQLVNSREIDYKQTANLTQPQTTAQPQKDVSTAAQPTKPQNKKPQNHSAPAPQSPAQPSPSAIKSTESQPSQANPRSTHKDLSNNSGNASDRSIPTPEPTTKTAQSQPTHQTNKLTNPSYTPDEINAMWQQVIASITSPMTQALLRQQCHLINLEHNSAVVGISSPPLLKMNQGKIPQIEAGFAQVCQRKIRVTLEVATSKAPKPSATSTTQQTTNRPTKVQERSLETKPPTNPAPPLVANPVAPKNPVPNNFTPPNSQPPARSNVQSPNSPPPQPEPNYPQANPNSRERSPNQAVPPQVQLANPEPTTPNDPNDGSNFQQALKLITQKFEGEVIDLDNSDPVNPAAPDDTESTREKLTATEEVISVNPVADTQQQSTSQDESKSSFNYDDEDVPF